MKKSSLKLVVCNTQKKNVIQKMAGWLKKNYKFRLPGQLSYSEKKTAITRFATMVYADYQATTGEVGLFPLTEAENFVKALESKNQLEKYYHKNKKRIAG